jgi:hypothetical protein
LQPTAGPFLESLKVKRKSGVFVQGARLKIRRKQAFEKFYRHIGFDTPRKKEMLRLTIT